MSETPINRDLARSQRNESKFAPVGNNIYELTLKALNLSEKGLQGKRILDIGSADAQFFARGAERNGLDVIAYDPVLANSAEIAAANKPVEIAAPEIDIPHRSYEPASKKVAGIAQYLPFKDSSFDLVVSYVAFPLYFAQDDYIQTLREISRVLKTGGSIVLAPVPQTEQFTSVDTFGPTVFDEAIIESGLIATYEDYHVPEVADRIERRLILTKPESND